MSVDKKKCVYYCYSEDSSHYLSTDTINCVSSCASSSNYYIIY